MKGKRFEAEEDTAVEPTPKYNPVRAAMARELAKERQREFDEDAKAAEVEAPGGRIVEFPAGGEEISTPPPVEKRTSKESTRSVDTSADGSDPADELSIEEAAAPKKKRKPNHPIISGRQRNFRMGSKREDKEVDEFHARLEVNCTRIRDEHLGDAADQLTSIKIPTGLLGRCLWKTLMRSESAIYDFLKEHAKDIPQMASTNKANAYAQFEDFFARVIDEATLKRNPFD